MGSRGATVVLSRANRIRTKLQSALEATVLEVDDVSHQHAGHAAVRGSSDTETHFNVKIVSSKFEGQSLVKRHRLVYDLLADELQSGLHALSIVAKTPNETTEVQFRELITALIFSEAMMSCGLTQTIRAQLSYISLLLDSHETEFSFCSVKLKKQNHLVLKSSLPI
ncbi:hypothetical protein V8G54_012260 [Vigna mungo]|uniref:Uncharacterized protein n=1 Tax=Vigna mungo TaxID=3915 RepID=A0AAQ3S0E9_VIGMU